jgi:hypothetical protein
MNFLQSHHIFNPLGLNSPLLAAIRLMKTFGRHPAASRGEVHFRKQIFFESAVRRSTQAELNFYIFNFKSRDTSGLS